MIVTLATDGAELYASEREKCLARRYAGSFDEVAAGEVFARHLLGIDTDHVLELSHRDRRRIFNLGYFTWVEQQGVALDDFERRLDQRFWRRLHEVLPVWDGLIEDFNRRTGVNLPA